MKRLNLLLVVTLGLFSASLANAAIQVDLQTGRILPPPSSEEAREKMGELIRRYSSPEMAAVWEEKNKFLNWVQIEHALVSQLHIQELISHEEWTALNTAFQEIISEGGINIQKMDERERVTRHDVNAFIDVLVEQLKEKGAGQSSRWVHAGLTSTDVVDTGNSIQLHQASTLILKEADLLLEQLKQLALEHKNTATIARTHGQHAELVTYGLRFLNTYEELKETRNRFEFSTHQLGGKLSGAVGTYSHFSPSEEAGILKQLGLKPMRVGTQVIARSYHAAWLHDLAQLTQVISKLAANLRLLAYPELDEVTIGFAQGQKGSSAMPHKKNPILEEKLMGLARATQGYSLTADLNIGLEFERDISHSCNERMSFPIASLLGYHAIKTVQLELSRMSLNDYRIQARLEELQDLPYSGHYLIALLQAGVEREVAYRAVQQASTDFRDQDRSQGQKVKSLKELLGENQEFGRSFLSLLENAPPDGESLGTAEYQFRHLDSLYGRVFNLLESN